MLSRCARGSLRHIIVGSFAFDPSEKDIGRQNPNIKMTWSTGVTGHDVLSFSCTATPITLLHILGAYRILGSFFGDRYRILCAGTLCRSARNWCAGLKNALFFRVSCSERVTGDRAAARLAQIVGNRRQDMHPAKLPRSRHGTQHTRPMMCISSSSTRRLFTMTELYEFSRVVSDPSCAQV